MNRQDIHQGILKRLLALRGQVVERVRLVARLLDEELLGGGTPERTFLFLPDLHLLSAAADEIYQYTFGKLAPGRRVNRNVLLDRVCGAMLEFWNGLPQDRSLKTVQLGDFVDLWRENEFAAEDIAGLVARILDDNPEARLRLVRSGEDSLAPDFLLGNHDLRMSASPEMRRARRAFAYLLDNRRPLLITHGDLFDDIETLLDDGLQKWFVDRFGPDVPANRYPLDRTEGRQDGEIGGSQGDGPIILEDDDTALPERVNVWVTVAPSEEHVLTESHRLLPRALEYAKGLRGGAQPYLAKMDLESALPDLRSIVIGHSHYARICIHRDSGNPRNDLVLADCGAWMEYSRFGDSSVPSCPIGVLCGGDLRIYQLDPHESLVH